MFLPASSPKLRRFFSAVRRPWRLKQLASKQLDQMLTQTGDLEAANLALAAGDLWASIERCRVVCVNPLLLL